MRSKLVISLTGYALAIVQFFLVTIYNLFSHIHPSLDGNMLSFLLAVIIIMATDRLTAQSDQNSLSDSLRRIFSRFDQLVHTEVMSSVSSMLYICERIKNARIVRSTTIASDAEMLTVSNEIHFESELYRRFLKSKYEYTKNGGVWTDVFSKNVADRFRDGDLNSCHHYNVLVLDSNPPFINFMLIVYRDNQKEVLFGWRYSEQNTDPPVVRSRDPRIVSLFTSQFSSIREQLQLE